MKPEPTEVLGNSAAAAESGARQLIPHLFHQLSQPLTSLCCSLELALLQPPAADEYSRIVSRALGQAEKVSWLVTAIRELFDAGQTGQDPEVLDLRRALEDAVGDLLPVAESAGIQLCYLPGLACPIWFDAHRLRQGLFHLLGFVVGSGGPGAVVTVRLEEFAENAAVRLTVFREGGAASASEIGQDPPQKLVGRLGMGIAHAIFEAAGGTFRMERTLDGVRLEVWVARREEKTSSSCARLDR